jgi:adenylyltransferase/sulfurtransferase
VLFSVADLGQPKALAARRRLAELNPEIALVAHAHELTAANVGQVFGAYDIVVDGTDRTAVRYLINDACVILGKPLVSAAIHRFEGHAMTYVPGRSPCYRCLFPDVAGAAVANCADAGVLGVLPGVLGTLQATEAIKIIVGQPGLLTGRLLAFDALEMRFEEFPFARRTDCAVCGETPRIVSLGDLVRGEAAAAGPFRRIAPPELAALIGAAVSGGPPVRLIDVREPAEFAAGHLDTAESVPLAELERGHPVLAPDGLTVFICRSGSRSARACEIALQRGMHEPANLDGGLLAWAAVVDPTLKVA